MVTKLPVISQRLVTSTIVMGYNRNGIEIQSALVISNSEGLSEIHRVPVLRHIRFPELRKKSNNQMPKIRNLTPLHKIY